MIFPRRRYAPRTVEDMLRSSDMPGGITAIREYSNIPVVAGVSCAPHYSLTLYRGAFICETLFRFAPFAANYGVILEEKDSHRSGSLACDRAISRGRVFVMYFSPQLSLQRRGFNRCSRLADTLFRRCNSAPARCFSRKKIYRRATNVLLLADLYDAL